MPPFQLVSDFKPTGDQPRAIEQLVQGVQNGQQRHTLLGATGTGKSIAHDDPVFVSEISHDGQRSRVLPIGELIDAALSARSGDVVWEGDTEILDVRAGGVQYVTQAFDPSSGEVSLHPISTFIRHATPQRMFDLTTHCGRSATLTGDHNLWVLRRGRLHLIRTDDAQPDDYLPLPLTLLGEGETSQLELLPYLADTGLHVDISDSFNRYQNLQGRSKAVQALREIGFAQPESKHLPDFWTDLNNPALAQMLRAYFDGDGTVDRANAVSAMTASKRLASDLAYALLRFGIWARISRRFKRATNTDHAGDWYYQVTISGQDDLAAFSQHIGFGLTRKQARLDEKLTGNGNTNVDVIPLDGATLRSLRQALGIRVETLAQRADISRAAVQLYEQNQRNPSRTTCRRLLTALSDLYHDAGQTDAAWEDDWNAIAALMHLRWTKIKRVEPADYQEPHVYDFCVPGVENFLAGYGGLFVHNTFVVSHVVQQLQRPTLVLAHNKTLAAQLYAEFKEFFPHNAVEYYVSYYDYYQPESYVPRFDLFIEKQTQINEHIERLRVASKAALLSRRDVLIVASVSCIYGTGDPDTWGKYILELRVGDTFKRENILRRLVQLQYARNDMDLAPGAFRVRGDTLEIFPFYEDAAYRILMFDDDIERVLRFDPVTGEVLADQPVVVVFPAAQFVADRDKLMKAVRDIEEELDQQVKFFKSQDKLLEAQRIEQRTRYDLEMLREVGFTSGIENYSRPLEQRQPGSPPHTLIDYFPDDYLLVIDESHMTLPQIRGMYNGDQARKQTLVDYGFRLPSAMDNRPLRFDEFEERMSTSIFVSATPGPYEMAHSEQVVQQIIRPTGIVDPQVFVRPTKGQIDDLLQEVALRVKKGQRALITTFTQRMSEELSGYLNEMGIKAHYLHADVETLERIEILRDLRMGVYDVIVGINLLREGIDLPEVSMVGILDADKEGFLRSETALIQTIGRAARHVEGMVILYGDKMTDSMKAAIAETERRRAIQIAHNEAHGIIPASIVKSIRDLTARVKLLATEGDPNAQAAPAQPDLQTMGKSDLYKLVKDIERDMKAAAQTMEFEKAAALRDQLFEVRGILALKEADGRVEDSDKPKDQRPASGNKRRGRGA